MYTYIVEPLPAKLERRDRLMIISWILSLPQADPRRRELSCRTRIYTRRFDWCRLVYVRSVVQRSPRYQCPYLSMTMGGQWLEGVVDSFPDQTRKSVSLVSV